MCSVGCFAHCCVACVVYIYVYVPDKIWRILADLSGLLVDYYNFDTAALLFCCCYGLHETTPTVTRSKERAGLITNSSSAGGGKALSRGRSPSTYWIVINQSTLIWRQFSLFSSFTLISSQIQFSTIIPSYPFSHSPSEKQHGSPRLQSESENTRI